jgi:hypothetical protein
VTPHAVRALLVAALCLGAGVADAQVPTVGDVASCNQQAREGSRENAASPTGKDEVDARAARKARASTVEAAGVPQPMTQSPDAQIHGMDADGAQDAAYRAAYRVCMRKQGF